MALTLSSLPSDYPGVSCKAAESFSAEWPITNLQALKNHLDGDGWEGGEGGEDSGSMPESLQRGLVVGRGWFKLDLGRRTTLVVIKLSEQHAVLPLHWTHHVLKISVLVQSHARVPEIANYHSSLPHFLSTVRHTM
jgi:hypothetical protein